MVLRGHTHEGCLGSAACPIADSDEGMGNFFGELTVVYGPRVSLAASPPLCGPRAHCVAAMRCISRSCAPRWRPDFDGAATWPLSSKSRQPSPARRPAAAGLEHVDLVGRGGVESGLVPAGAFAAP